MKGIILAGGTGSRLYPCTKVTNKHLLPVFDRPMIHYPIQTLKESGIRDILIISSSEHAGDFMQLLGSGMEFDVKLTYKIQDGAGGIAQALSLAEDFAAGESVAVILSDNIFEKNFSDEAFYFHRGAQIFVKKVEDWSVINYIFEKMIDALVPNYDEMIGDQADLGTDGTTIGDVDKTPFQRAWIEVAGIERTSYDSIEKPDLFLEYLDIQHRFHQKAAEITAGCPAMHITLIDNITNIISPKFYREFCMPYYDIYTKALAGTGKKFAVHHDGLLRHIRNEIHQSSFDILDSFTVPPVGNISLSEAREIFPEKILAVNLPPHLAFASKKELHEGYEKILDEHGKKCLIIEHVEDLPEESLENHLAAALDVCGY